MAPNPQNVITDGSAPDKASIETLGGDAVVISGIAGMFPKSDNTLELMENLYNKVDMVREVNCSTIKHPELPKYLGKMSGQDKFDAQFFRVTPWQASSMDPLTRKIMETAFSAMYDSGVNPVTLAGTRLGVYVGSSYTDVSTINLYNVFRQNGFILSGCSRSMTANRISYWVDGKGPSYCLDLTCASSMACLELAYTSLINGESDAAIVGGCNCCVHPILSINLKCDSGYLSLDGKTKCFDKRGDGYVRAEAVNVLFLQKAKNAKRIYAEICHIKGKYFTRPDANFLPIRKSEDLVEFLEEFYSEINISPSEVEYVEAFGSGIAEADGSELDAIGRFFAKSRSVKVGSVKSNMGHTEAASGTSSVIKLCIAYHKGELPANLHYNEPQDHIPAIRDGRIQVVTENVPFGRGYTAINNFSYTGANFHVLLKGHYKNKDKFRYNSNIPRLILISGRDENGVNKILDALTSQPIDHEQIALLHNIYKHNISGHTGRSYTILDTNEQNETITIARNFDFYSGSTRPVWFLYSGMGSQWVGMGTELLRIPIFAAAIERCRRVLEPVGVDIINILTSQDKSIFDTMLNSMVGISAVQIGLTDVIKAMGIVPDNIIGHSMGELGCAYADGCLTAEEMILSSYWRGLVSVQTPFIRGLMAAVGLGYKDVLPLCPPEIEVACHNSSQSSTISGPADIVEKFIAELTAKGIFARVVPTSNIAYHSRYVSQAGPKLFPAMEKLIKEPKLRSNKWISTSVAQDKWDQPHAKYASAEYMTNNLLSPVYFEENAYMIPRDAIIIEIAPHGLMQAIMKGSHKECINISLTKRDTQRDVIFLLEAIGKLYQVGLNPQIDVLYPKVEFPVSIETPFLSHLVAWEHSVDWPLVVESMKETIKSSARNIVVSIYDDEYKYLEGHIRNGINEIPEGTLLFFVWESFAMYSGKNYEDMSVTFKNVNFLKQPIIPTEDVLRFQVMIHKGSNRFEVTNGSTQIANGYIHEKLINEEEIKYSNRLTEDNNETYLNEKDIYTILGTRGYEYGNEYRSIYSTNKNRNKAYIKWTNRWSTFLDSLIQMNALAKDHDGVCKPKIINKLRINIDEHKKEDKIYVDGVSCYKAETFEHKTVTRCGGVEMFGIIFENEPKIEQYPDVLATRVFVQHIMEENVDFNTAILIQLQLVSDNIPENTIKIAEIRASNTSIITEAVKEYSNKITSKNVTIKQVNINDIITTTINEFNLLIVQNVSGDVKTMTKLINTIGKNTYILAFEQSDKIYKITNNLRVLSKMSIDKRTFILLQKDDKSHENVTYIRVNHDSKFSWWPHIQNELRKERRVVLVSEKRPYCGLLGMVKNLKQENKKNIGIFIIDDHLASSFDPDNDIYKEQIQKNITFNVFKKGQWGSYYYIPSSKSLNLSSLSLTSTTFKDLENFIWIESPLSTSSTNLVQISYAGLSLRDCQKAAGEISDGNSSFGFDFSGIDSRGQRVMGLVKTGALGSIVESDQALLWPVPSYWNMEDAATVPLPYVYAYYCLTIRNQLFSHQTVFVLGGAGGLGQAVISICLNLGCTVFTTVSSLKKKQILLKLFPKLQGDNIHYSRHDNFVTKVKEFTKNERCDFVISCSSGCLREAAMKCVGFTGTFLDLSDVDMNRNINFGMAYLWEARNYMAIDISNLLRTENYNEKKVLQKAIAEGISMGVVRPLSRVVYSSEQVPRAFRLLSASKHVGRVLVRMEDSKLVNSNYSVTPRMSYSDGVHIVVCDKMNLGVELVNHLIKNGAKKIVMRLIEDYNTNYLNFKSESWKKLDVTVHTNKDNIQTKEGCERLLKVGQTLGPVAGIYIVQDYKEDENIDDTKISDFVECYNQTALIVSNLDMTSRYICLNLRHFVLITISTKNISNKYTISTCERICEGRKESEFPALIINTDIPTKDAKTKNNLLLAMMPTLSTLLNSMDISLKLQYNNVFTVNLTKQTTSAIDEKLCKIIGALNINDINEDLTINELGINDTNLNEIKTELSIRNLSTGELQDLTIARLRNLSNNVKNQTTNYGAGFLYTFYNYIEKDEYVATDALVPMNTQRQMNRYKSHLLMIPGFEGNHRVFKSVAETLKIQAMTLQMEPDLICDGIPEMAKILTKRIKSNFKITSKFYLLSYSFGVNVALEVARLLEAEVLRGVVYCLDSSPDLLKVQLNSHIGNLTDTQLNSAIIEHMYALITGKASEELKRDLDCVDDLSKKVDICVSRLKGQVHFSFEHEKSIFESATKRIALAREYDLNFKLESEIILIKGIPHPDIADQLSEDYNLFKYTNQPVKVFNVEADHVSVPYDCRVPYIINSTLDSELLEEFKRNNVCDLYYV